MRKPFERLAQLDKLVHEPARLAILTALSSCGKASFTFLRTLTGLTKGNLSSHLSKLEDAGFVDVEKTYDGKTPVTYAAISEHGRRTLARYWDDLSDLRAAADAFTDGDGEGEAAGSADET